MPWESTMGKTTIETDMARSEMAERQKPVSKILNGRSQLMASRINQPRNSTVPVSKYAIPSRSDKIPTIQICTVKLPTRRLIRRPGDTCANIIYGDSGKNAS